MATHLNDTSGQTKTSFLPWGPQATELQKMYGNADNIYAQNIKNGPIGFDNATIGGLNAIQHTASGPNPFLDSATGAVTGIGSGANRIGTASQFGDMYSQPGISTSQYSSLMDNPAISNSGMYQNLFNNKVSPSQLNSVFQQSQNPGVLSGGLYAQIASGDLLNNAPTTPQYDQNGNPIATPGGGPATGANPYSTAALQNALTATANQTKAGLSSSGRYGSSAYGDAMGKALGSVATNFNFQAYQDMLNRQMQAAQGQSQENLGLQGLGLQSAQAAANLGLSNQQNQLNAAQGLSNVQGQNQAAALAAAQGLTGAQQAQNQARLSALQGQTGVQSQNIANQLAAAGMAPQMNDLRYADANQMLQVGAARQQQAQQEQNFPWQQLQQKQGIIGNLPGTAGSSTTQQPSAPWWQTLLGAAGAGAGILGGIFGA